VLGIRPQLGATGRWWKLQEVEPSGRYSTVWGSVIEWDIETLAPPLSLLSIPTLR
jgi:hypothetical protein